MNLNDLGCFEQVQERLLAVLKSIGDIYAVLFGWPAAARFNKAIFYLSSRGLGFHNYSSQGISGELRILNELIRNIASPVVFDVGANNGDWSALALKANRLARIHAFEPQAALAAHIAATYPAIAINTLAVGEVAGELDLYDYADHPGSQHASVLKGVIDSVHGGTPRISKVSVVTIDDYCRQHGVQHIDFMKIDVEGYEFAVLNGAKEMISAGRIQAIQFEFNEMNVTGRTFLQDFMNALGNNYCIYRILPHGRLELKTHNHWFNEQYAYQNILALRS